MMYANLLEKVLTFTGTLYLAAFAEPRVILSGPQDQLVAPGDLVYFSCHARGSRISCIWYINDTSSSPRSYYNERGFQFTDRQISIDECNDTLTVIAYDFNNNTRIKCTAHPYGQGMITQVGTLVIASIPLKPEFNMSTMHSVNNSFKHTIFWVKPFTWLDFPITSYTVNVTNVFNRQVTSFVKIIDSQNSSDSQLSHSFTSDGDFCYTFKVSLIASNAIGDSAPSTLNTGHPIVIDEIKNITVISLFLSNGMPISRTNFFVPRLCPTYQKGTYSATIYASGGEFIHWFGPTEYRQKEEQTQIQIVKELKNGLNKSQHYQLQLNIESNGISHQLVESFNTFYYGFHDLAGDYCSCNTSKSMNEQENIAIVKYVAISGVGGAFFIVLVILIALLMCIQRKKKNSRSRLWLTAHHQLDIDAHETSVLQQTQNTRTPPNLKLEASNPIYEGAVYETTPGESLKCLQSPLVTPSNDLAFRYTLEQTPKLPPPRKATPQSHSKSKCCEGSSDTKPNKLDLTPIHQAQTGDEYMIMSSTHSL